MGQHCTPLLSAMLVCMCAGVGFADSLSSRSPPRSPSPTWHHEGPLVGRGGGADRAAGMSPGKEGRQVWEEGSEDDERGGWWELPTKGRRGEHVPLIRRELKDQEAAKFDWWDPLHSGREQEQEGSEALGGGERLRGGSSKEAAAPPAQQAPSLSDLYMRCR